VIIARADLMSPEAQSLIACLNQELTATYPEEGATHFRLDPAELAPGRGGFLVAREEVPLGCGAVRLIDPAAGLERAELKRMFVKPEARGRGVGRALLEALLEEARALGAAQAVLETGVRQTAALALYVRAGFTRIPAWGEYTDSPLSLCLMKLL
jgi:GNAT superfamily N-acetyltransferase